MKLVRIRKAGHEKVLAVPKVLAERIGASYMAVSLDGDGRLIYTPILETA